MYTSIVSVDRERGNTKTETQPAKAAIASKLALLLCDPKCMKNSYLFGNFTELC
jgi:hypothetical protein